MDVHSSATQLDAIYHLLSKVAELDEEEISAVVNYVLRSLRCNTFSPQSWFSLLLYILEREPEAIARSNVVRIIHELVLSERLIPNVGSRCPSLLFKDLVRKEIAAISHAADIRTSCEVRIYLHQCIFGWIEAKIVTTQFLKQLQRQEETWKFRRDRPKYNRTPEGSPSTFDLILLGIQGRQPGLDGNINMRKLVQQGMVRGVREGWMRVDERGRHVVVTTLLEVSIRPSLTHNVGRH